MSPEPSYQITQRRPCNEQWQPAGIDAMCRDGTATHLNNLAGVVEVQGRYPEAEGLYRQALEIDRATIGEAHPAFATCHVPAGCVVI